MPHKQPGQLELAAVGGGERDEDAVAPLAFVGGAQRQDANLRGGGGGVLRNHAADIAAGSAVDEELLHRIGQEAVAAVGILAQISAELPLVIGKARHKGGSAHNRPLHRHADKAGGTGPYALNRPGRGVKFFNVYTWRKIFSHTLLGFRAGPKTPPPFKV